MEYQGPRNYFVVVVVLVVVGVQTFIEFCHKMDQVGSIWIKLLLLLLMLMLLLLLSLLLHEDGLTHDASSEVSLEPLGPEDEGEAVGGRRVIRRGRALAYLTNVKD